MLSPISDPAASGFDPRRLSRLDVHFARYVDDGLLPGWQIVVTRRGEVVHSSTYGQRDREAGLPVTEYTMWRIYSMTKPLTTVAAMSLWEEGRFELTDELSRFIPSFADVRVYDKGSALRPFTVPAIELTSTRRSILIVPPALICGCTSSVMPTFWRVVVRKVLSKFWLSASPVVIGTSWPTRMRAS